VRNKEDHPMRFTKCFVVFGLCLLIGSCPFDPDINISIGYSEYLLEEWNRRNMLDYKLSVRYFDNRSQKGKGATITVRNGIPESSDPPEWLTSGKMSTVPEIYSFIKEEEKRIKKKAYRSITFIVEYNFDYSYPRLIKEYPGEGIQNSQDWDGEWNIKVTPVIWTGNGEE
jgi:hypothetical protein